jgi:hypothetical protein
MPKIENTGDMPTGMSSNKIQNTKEGTKKTSIRESILADIHAKNIRPRARWQYVLLHMGLWCSGIVTIFLWAFACAFMILEFSLPERAYLHWMETQDDLGWLLALPYLWGIGMIFALTIGYFVFSKTGRSYRLHAGVITAILIMGSLIGGMWLYITRMAHWSDRQIQRFEPRYRGMRENFAHILPRPEDGILALRVLSVTWDIIRGKTPDGQDWEVTLICSSDECRERRQKVIPGRPALFEWSISGKATFSAIEFLLPPKGLPKNMRMKSSPILRIFQWDHGLWKKGE